MKSRRYLIVAALLLAACKPAFNAGTYATTDDLHRAAMAEFNAGRWDNAIKAFERLTTELPARDPRTGPAYFYLAKSQEKHGDHLLAAKSYSRLYEVLPEDTLADDALFASGIEYQGLWRKPVLDAEYGENATTQFQALLGVYPSSPLVPRVRERLVQLDEWFATKDYETGHHYLRRKAYDSAIIYFKDVIRLHPSAATTRDAYLRLLEAYRAIRYRDDARDLCDAMRKAYPGDREVSSACPPVPAAAATP